MLYTVVCEKRRSVGNIGKKVPCRPSTAESSPLAKPPYVGITAIPVARHRVLAASTRIPSKPLW